jgi:hypothetical protein
MIGAIVVFVGLHPLAALAEFARWLRICAAITWGLALWQR